MQIIPTRVSGEKVPAARKPRKQTDPPSGSPGGATGCEVDVNSRAVEGRNGGTLTPHPPGSNGGVRRGPDRFPRRHYVRVMFLGALSDLGLSLEDLRRQRKHRKGSSLIPLAMLQHCKQGYKNLAIDAALGKSEAYGPFLRMMADAHSAASPHVTFDRARPPARG